MHVDAIVAVRIRIFVYVDSDTQHSNCFHSGNFQIIPSELSLIIWPCIYIFCFLFGLFLCPAKFAHSFKFPWFISYAIYMNANGIKK